MSDLQRALVLGVGGTRAIGAHIGVIQYLQERDWNPDCVVGSSAGADIAMLVAFGHTGMMLESFAKRLTPEIILPNTFANLAKALLGLSNGLFSTHGIRNFLKFALGKDPLIEEAEIPLAMVACAIGPGISGVEVFRSGSAVDAACASSAIPGIYDPVKIAGKWYVDGGLLSSLPVDVAYWQFKAKEIIAVQVSGSATQPLELDRPDNFVEVLSHCARLAAHENSRYRWTGLPSEARVHVVNVSVPGVSLADTHKIPFAIEEGYKAAEAQLSWLLGRGDTA